jgi:hypothetical protein
MGLVATVFTLYFEIPRRSDYICLPYDRFSPGDQSLACSVSSRRLVGTPGRKACYVPTTLSCMESGRQKSRASTEHSKRLSELPWI